VKLPPLVPMHMNIAAPQINRPTIIAVSRDTKI
jgi:hypothetical protein